MPFSTPFRHSAAEYLLFFFLHTVTFQRHYLHSQDYINSLQIKIQLNLFMQLKKISHIGTRNLNVTLYGCPSNHFFYSSAIFLFHKATETQCCISSDHLHHSLSMMKLLCNIIKWYELLTNQLTIQSYSAFHLVSNTIPPSVSPSMLFVDILAN